MQAATSPSKKCFIWFSRKFLGCPQIVGNDICRAIFIQFLLAVVDILIGGYKFFNAFESFSKRMLIAELVVK